MAVKFDSPIIHAQVVKEAYKSPEKEKPANPFEGWKFKRPERLVGSTYKISPPVMDDSIYITITDAEFPDGSIRPVELFIVSKDMQSFQWISLISRLVSALFRQPGPFPSYAIDEFLETYDPHGSYFIPGGKGQVNSIVAHIGVIIREHCANLGLIKGQELSPEQQELIAKKKEEYLANITKVEEGSNEVNEIPGATQCPKCHQKSMIKMDNCETCLNCGHSKCG